MIPSHWFRRIVLGLFILELAGLVMWLSAVLVPNPADKPFAQTVAGIVFLLGYYTAAPWYVQFLAPVPSTDENLHRRLRTILSSMPHVEPVFLYDNKNENASSVGILPSHSRVYVTSALMRKMSDEGVRGVLAHEAAHVRERHIFVIFIYAACYALVSHIAGSNHLFFLGLLAFLALRRHLEYRADAGAARMVGAEATLTFLRELREIYGSSRWSRLFMFLLPYPPLAVRMDAVLTGRRPIF